MGKVDFLAVALYHKYRPATFAEVRGQEHVTRPLSVALDSGNIGHAYLFSGPRGCGKTSSARILARSLNCEKGPTSTPCGECDSCRALAPGGHGNLDVTELDAASHGSVDDMRELRESAVFAPSESRYRIFIIDEAHMITQQGANALLKIVEEPPEHLVFIFATTEPEKIIGTIRSRVQHYPFRLLTPPVMRGLLQDVCAGEGVEVEDSVFTPVIRAGGGSPRDTLSILDQLLAGVPAGEALTYELAAPLLGVTDSTLLDSAVRVIATHDAPGAFSLVGQVIDRGIDPKRFTSDLLDRFRDLMVLQAVPDALTSGLVDAPAALHPELSGEVALFSGQKLPHLTSLVNTGLEGMRGTLAPRILLEVLMARLLSAGTPGAAAIPDASVPMEAPQAEVSEAGKKYMRRSQRTQPQQAPATAAPAPATPATETMPPTQTTAAPAPATPATVTTAPTRTTAPTVTTAPTAAPQPEPQPAPEPQPEEETPGTGTSTSVGVDAETVRGKWTDILNHISRERKNTTARILLRGAKILDVRDGTLYLGILTGAIVNRLNDAKHNADIAAAVKAETGAGLGVVCVLGEKIPAAPETAPVETAAAPALEPQEEPAPEPATPADTADAPVPRWKQMMNDLKNKEAEPPQHQPEPPLPPLPHFEPADVPPPPEPDIPLPPEPTEEELEEEMVRAATEDPGTHDHRTPKDLAMDLLQSELGAKPM